MICNPLFRPGEQPGSAAGGATASSKPGEDAVRRLGKAAEAAQKRSDDYWASLGGGNKMRD